DHYPVALRDSTCRFAHDSVERNGKQRDLAGQRTCSLGERRSERAESNRRGQTVTTYGAAARSRRCTRARAQRITRTGATLQLSRQPVDASRHRARFLLTYVVRISRIARRRSPEQTDEPSAR